MTNSNGLISTKAISSYLEEQPITLEGCEKDIEQVNKLSDLLVGARLKHIRETALYKDGYENWTDYCKRRWDRGIEWARLKIKAYETYKTIKESDTPTNVGVLPDTEGQLRPLTKLNEDDQARAWETAVMMAGGGKPTGEIVKQAVEQIERENSINEALTHTPTDDEIENFDPYAHDLPEQMIPPPITTSPPRPPREKTAPTTNPKEAELTQLSQDDTKPNNKPQKAIPYTLPAKPLTKTEKEKIIEVLVSSSLDSLIIEKLIKLFREGG